MKALLISAVAVTGLSMVSCGNNDEPSIEDLEELFDRGYKNETEDFLNDDVQVENAVGGEVSDASCDEPDNTDVGTEYQCTAEVAELGTATFDVLINEKDSFLVTDFNF